MWGRSRKTPVLFQVQTIVWGVLVSTTPVTDGKIVVERGEVWYSKERKRGRYDLTNIKRRVLYDETRRCDDGVVSYNRG